MEFLIIAGVAVAIACWFYKVGKREGSQRGFRAGRRRRGR